MSVMAGLRCNQQIRSFYQLLRKQGKPAKVTLVACMRKLLTILNAMIRDHTPWQPQPATCRSTPWTQEHNRCDGPQQSSSPPWRAG